VIDLDHELVLKNPHLWDEATLQWALDQKQAWDDYEEDGPQDLETTLDSALERSPVRR